MAYLLGIMAMSIYNQTYGSSGIVTLMEQYNKVIDRAIALPAFQAIITVIQSIAVGFTVLFYFIDLSEKVTEKNFSPEQFLKATLRCVTAYMFIVNAVYIVGLLMDIGASLADATGSSDAVFFDSTKKTYLLNGLAKLKITEAIGYVVSCILPWIIAFIGEAIIQIVLISRILEVVVMTIFAPMSIADIYREGTASPGVQFMKKMLALGLQVAAIIIINMVTQLIIVQLMKDANKTSTTMIKLLTDGGVVTNNGISMYPTENIKQFLDALTQGTKTLQAFGVTLARIGLIWNSLPLCEEITGAK